MQIRHDLRPGPQGESGAQHLPSLSAIPDLARIARVLAEMERAVVLKFDSFVSMAAKAGEMFLMTTTPVSLRSAASARSRALRETVRDRRRRIDPVSGRALEILGHAIEYLADEHAHRGGSLAAEDPVVAAMQILMERNRQIYFACPVVPTLGERWRAMLRRSIA